MFAFISTVQLALDSLDRLVDTLEERGTLSAVEAAQSLFATPSISDGLACSLLEEVTAGDSRVVCTGATVSLAGSRADPLLEEADFVVFDLETTGLSATHCRICEPAPSACGHSSWSARFSRSSIRASPSRSRSRA